MSPSSGRLSVMSQPRRLRTRSPSTVETMARKPSHFGLICHRQNRVVVGDCPECKREHAERGKPRREANKRRLRRDSKQWKAISREARRRNAYCAKCGSLDDLTTHLPRGGDHSTATIEEVQVLCRRCHGRMTGAGSQRPTGGRAGW
jgi:5-methylcytosine-specific restriction endonuclease McrA